MPLLPLMQFIFDTDWPTSGVSVFMTPTRVWGPLAVSLLAALFFLSGWILFVGLIVTGVQLWIDPKYYESVNWKEVMDTNE